MKWTFANISHILRRFKNRNKASFPLFSFARVIGNALKSIRYVVTLVKNSNVCIPFNRILMLLRNLNNHLSKLMHGLIAYHWIKAVIKAVRHMCFSTEFSSSSNVRISHLITLYSVSCVYKAKIILWRQFNSYLSDFIHSKL